MLKSELCENLRFSVSIVGLNFCNPSSGRICLHNSVCDFSQSFVLNIKIIHMDLLIIFFNFFVYHFLTNLFRYLICLS